MYQPHSTMDIMGNDRKKEKSPVVKTKPNMAFVGVGGIVPKMVRAMADMIKTMYMTKNSGLLLALLYGEKSRKGSKRSSNKAKLKAIKPKNLLGMDLNMV